jgi:tetratricopeptide (TPR) repeat protein
MSTRTPIVRQISWVAAIPAFVVAAAAIVTGVIVDPRAGVVWGAGAFLAYSLGSRRLIARSHRRGIALVKQGQFGEAIGQFQQSLAFFDRHPWGDRFRCVTLMSASATSYREMALVNIAFCYSQIGDGKRAREFYEACLACFPGSGMATAAIRLMDAGRSAG